VPKWRREKILEESLHPSARIDLPAWPFCGLVLKGQIPRRGYPSDPKTLGEHICKTRLDRRLQQIHVARELDVSVGTVKNWERNRTAVAARLLPRVVAFLGYDPGQKASELPGTEAVL